ncbi:ABC transporter permease [Aurantimonas endophytica]|uniref:ABC-type polysaccharide/polyol phosphate export permease n=1 Tax=Aurantimonas endophytica TaxID=1522175 RepID=A0A7W6HDN0_9HYPH|nr:ABC transporter permease [Aurantimonas endophytica]MBB4003058.1 ABC-type polysaccharide/polyol phosphate export permease [Aurantimonas endophytica]MCO6403929.1 ABC transporter permease [Aurantimonas endophytica]
MSVPETSSITAGASRDPSQMDNLRREIALAWYFAWSDTRARYKRSVLGPFWLVLSTILGVGGLGLVWSVILDVDRETFLPMLTVGLVLWQLVAGCVVSAANVFHSKASIIKNMRTPTWRISLQQLFTQIVNFVHNLVIVAIVLALYPATLSPLAFLSIFGLLLVLANLFWVIQLVGFLGARYRDLDPLINSIMPVLFFLSPVLFRSRDFEGLDVFMTINPIAYWIEVVRDPVQGIVPSLSVYAVTIGMAVVGWILALAMTRAKAARLPFWV